MNNKPDTYYYLADILKLFNINSGSVAYAIRSGKIPKPELVKKKHQLVRRWCKEEIDEFIRDEFIKEGAES